MDERRCTDCGHFLRQHSTRKGEEVAKAQGFLPVYCVGPKPGHDAALCTHMCGCTRVYDPESRPVAGRI